MQKLTVSIRKIFIALVICVQVFAAPALIVSAESADESSTAAAAASTNEAPAPASETAPVVEVVTSPPPAPTYVAPAPPTIVAPVPPAALAPGSTGPQSPTGVSGSTYVFNSVSGLWENDQYTWDPVTKQTKPKVAPTYSFNPVTQMWDTTEWYFSPEAGKYVPNKVSTAIRPVSLGGGGGGNFSINGTGPNSNNTINNTGTSTGTFDLFFNASISNQISSTTSSGDALLQGNTIGGNALSGDAEAIANILNLLQSSWGSQSDIATFIASLDGTIFGDLLLDPAALAGAAGSSDVDITVSNNASINNDINVAVNSGDATVSGNTKAGDATSGNARALINLLNLINSSITSDKSFIGILNINGDLNGDILLPQSFLEYLLYATGPNSNNQINGGTSNNLAVTTDTNRSIVNDIDAEAGTGDASVSQNTSAGSAGSGTADTKVNTMNLVGQNVNGKNGLLVFVNVFGKWVGLLFNAPQGTSSIATTGPNSNNTINDAGSNKLTVNATENSLINNDVDVTARSGDATVSGNTSAGNAKSGNADIGVSILNLIDSNLNFSDFFGVLFINVFGSWNGSFGIDTAAGNRPAAAAGGQGGGTFGFVPAANQAAQQNPASTASGPADKFFGLIGSLGSGGGNVAVAPQTSSASVVNAGAAVPAANNAAVAASASQASTQNWWLPLVAILLVGPLLYADRIVALVRRAELFSHIGSLRRMP